MNPPRKTHDAGGTVRLALRGVERAGLGRAVATTALVKRVEEFERTQAKPKPAPVAPREAEVVVGPGIRDYPRKVMVNSRLYTFVAGNSGDWSIASVKAMHGEALPAAPRLAVVNAPGETWALSGATSNTRYTALAEKQALTGIQSNLGRPTATRAALIPIRRKTAWWDLTQDLEDLVGELRTTEEWKFVEREVDIRLLR